MSVKIAGCHCQKMCYILVAVKFVAEFSSFTAKDATSLPSLAQKCAHLFVFLIEQMVILFCVSFWLVLACVCERVLRAHINRDFALFAFTTFTQGDCCIAILGEKNVGDKRKNVGDFLENVHRFSERVHRFLEKVREFFLGL